MLTKAQIQMLRGLREKKLREAEGLFVVEGPKVVAELTAEGQPWTHFFATTSWTGPLPPGATPVTTEEMARISHFPTPSSVLAVGELRRVTLQPDELRRGLTLALDGVQDAGNVGTLLRIADWFGFARVLLSPDCADLFSQKVINASMGSFARVRVATLPLAPVLVGAGVPVLGCDLEGTPVYALPPATEAIIVIGSEGRGLSPEVAAAVTRRITVPRRGRAESLNAAVAAGIVASHLCRPAGPAS